MPITINQALELLQLDAYIDHASSPEALGGFVDHAFERIYDLLTELSE